MLVCSCTLHKVYWTEQGHPLDMKSKRGTRAREEHVGHFCIVSTKMSTIEHYLFTQVAADDILCEHSRKIRYFTFHLNHWCEALPAVDQKRGHTSCSKQNQGQWGGSAGKGGNQPAGLSFTSRTHVVEEKTNSAKLCSDLYTYPHGVASQTYTYAQAK